MPARRRRRAQRVTEGRDATEGKVFAHDHWARRLPHIERVDRPWVVTLHACRRYELTRLARPRVLDALLALDGDVVTLESLVLEPAWVQARLRLTRWALPVVVERMKEVSARALGDGGRRVWRDRYDAWPLVEPDPADAAWPCRRGLDVTRWECSSRARGCGPPRVAPPPGLPARQ